MIFKCEDYHYFYKLTKNLPINSPVQRKIPAKNILVDCIHINWLSTACQSEGKVLLPVKTKNRVFSVIILSLSVIFCIGERSCLQQFIYQRIKISIKWSIWRCTATLKNFLVINITYNLLPERTVLCKLRSNQQSNVREENQCKVAQKRQKCTQK